MCCVIRDTILTENFDKRSDCSAIDTAGNELTREQRKIIIKFSNSNSNSNSVAMVTAE